MTGISLSSHLTPVALFLHFESALYQFVQHVLCVVPFVLGHAHGFQWTLIAVFNCLESCFDVINRGIAQAQDELDIVNIWAY